MNCVDPQVSHVESVGNGSDLEPPVKRRRGRPPMESNVSSFSPKVTSVTGAGGTEEVFIVSTEYLLLEHYSLTQSLTPWCRILFEKLIVTQLIKKYPAMFKEPEGSSPCSQKPADGPHSEPAESSSLHQSLSP